MRAEGVFIDRQRFQVNTKLNAQEFAAFPIMVLPLPDQHRIEAELNVLQSQASILKDLQVKTAAETDSLLSSILACVFEGKL